MLITLTLTEILKILPNENFSVLIEPSNIMRVEDAQLTKRHTLKK